MLEADVYLGIWFSKERPETLAESLYFDLCSAQFNKLNVKDFIDKVTINGFYM
jgi:hypothetical protein